jgi:hypothetical protein
MLLPVGADRPADAVARFGKAALSRLGTGERRDTGQWQHQQQQAGNRKQPARYKV